jgi:hypothetical protein
MLEMRIEFESLLKREVKDEILGLLSLDELKRLSNCCSSIKSKSEGIKSKEEKYFRSCELLEKIDENIVRLGGKVKKVDKKYDMNDLGDVLKGLNNVRSKISIGLGKGLKANEIEKLREEEKKFIECRDRLKGKNVVNVIDGKINELLGLVIEGDEENNKKIMDMVEMLRRCK